MADNPGGDDGRVERLEKRVENLERFAARLVAAVSAAPDAAPAPVAEKPPPPPAPAPATPNGEGGDIELGDYLGDMRRRAEVLTEGKKN